MKTTITLAAVLFFAACSLHAQVTPTGKSKFAPLPLAQGRPGRVVTFKANLYEETFDASTRRKEWRPLPGASVGFSVDPLAIPGGYLPVGNLATTRVDGSATARYRIPRKHPHPREISYKAKYEGDLSHRDTYDTGKLRVK